MEQTRLLGFGDLFLMVLSALFIPRGLYANVRVRPQNKLPQSCLIGFTRPSARREPEPLPTPTSHHISQIETPPLYTFCKGQTVSPEVDEILLHGANPRPQMIIHEIIKYETNMGGKNTPNITCAETQSGLLPSFLSMSHNSMTERKVK
ncbi:unnamed protein product [Fusarium graminearum]|uniref:Uncharacterized protein n=1 Tax=Gibberella zeae TaxID=5518 RepID=A0A4E9D5B4_GIBZA|nr:unnamed protein product [Fusarium graminearum]CAG1968243.1 unnamed protein product [Fusarium graminearum]CAG1976996.1 unnamed protein product [Fusarium graminearum]